MLSNVMFNKFRRSRLLLKDSATSWKMAFATKKGKSLQSWNYKSQEKTRLGRSSAALQAFARSAPKARVAISRILSVLGARRFKPPSR